MSKHDSSGTYTLKRREFVQKSMAAAAMLAAGRGFALSSPKRGAQVKRYGALEELPPGAVQPQGWLDKQGDSWWPWEQKAYWIDGATRLALVTQDQALLEKVQTIFRYTLQHQNTDGYLGPKSFEDPKGDEHRWPQNVFFRGLTATAGAHVGSPGIATAMSQHYLQDQADYGVSERNITNVESITLVSYGATHLRVTVFPTCTPSSNASSAL